MDFALGNQMRILRVAPDFVGLPRKQQFLFLEGRELFFLLSPLSFVASSSLEITISSKASTLQCLKAPGSDLKSSFEGFSASFSPIS